MNDTEKVKLEEYIELFNEYYKKKDLQKRIMYIGKSTWANSITKKKQTLDNLYCFADYERWYPSILTGIKIEEYTPEIRTDENGKEYKHKNFEDSKIIRIYETIVHRNLSKPKTVEIIDLEDKNEVLTIYGEDFCTTVHGNMCFGRIKGIEKIIAGQLIGQNGNSPMTEKYSVVNDKIDYPIKTADTNEILKANSDILQLITHYSGRTILDSNGNYKAEYTDLLLKENEIAIKLRNDSYYLRISKNYLPENKNNISDYYKIITYEMQQKRLENIEIKKEEVDMSVIGLGSAGTGILDQVARSNYFEKYMLIDFDSVEEKNKRNQWYSNRDIGCSKVYSSKVIMERIKCGNSILEYNKKFQEVPLNVMKTKYVVSGFDNLECRKELLEKIKSGEFEAKYLIDLRYLDLACSIYFIDMEDERQVSYYEKQLNADIKGFEEQEEREQKYLETDEEILEYLTNNRVFYDSCDKFSIKFFGTSMPLNNTCPNDGCGKENCRDCWLKRIREHNVKIAKQEEENTCVKQNIIDIYKFSSSFVFSAIREIESENPKPFTHIEAQTDILPTYTVFKK